MVKRILASMCVILAVCFAVTSFAAAAEQETTGAKAKGFWQRLFNYPANVTKETVSVVAETGKGGARVVTDEVKKVGQVTSGDIAKTPDLITEPLKTTGDTTYKAVTDTAKMPVEAAKEEAVK